MNQVEICPRGFDIGPYLTDAMEGADVFLGLSVKGVVKPRHALLNGGASYYFCHGQPGS